MDYLDYKKQLIKDRKRVEKWLLANQRFINITGIEKEIRGPKGLVQKFLKYNVPINDKWIPDLHVVVKSITTLSLR